MVIWLIKIVIYNYFKPHPHHDLTQYTICLLVNVFFKLKNNIIDDNYCNKANIGIQYI